MSARFGSTCAKINRNQKLEDNSSNATIERKFYTTSPTFKVKELIFKYTET